MRAQRTDSTTVGVKPPARTPKVSALPDSFSRLPISPRRAFLTSLVAPGYMQLKFKRPKAATIFLAAEAGGIGMALKSKHDLDLAKAAKLDTVFTPVLDNLGKPVVDSVTGKPKTTGALRNQNLADRVKARRTHFEDWIAVIVFNHLFAGADAYVAANLQDFNTNVNVTSTDKGVQILAKVFW
ncbi:MAG TPA: DUF5683 domain-containing protein [Gemmatimonadaceae bacterium]|nr:DUF5683 domain-containing protein [Gemmatimonadaceae bacterium]